MFFDSCRFLTRLRLTWQIYASHRMSFENASPFHLTCAAMLNGRFTTLVFSLFRIRSAVSIIFQLLTIVFRFINRYYFTLLYRIFRHQTRGVCDDCNELLMVPFIFINIVSISLCTSDIWALNVSFPKNMRPGGCPGAVVLAWLSLIFGILGRCPLLWNAFTRNRSDDCYWIFQFWLLVCRSTMWV